MPRTTVDIAAPILRELKRQAAREHKSLGQVISELLAPVLANQGARGARGPPPFHWQSQRMAARVDVTDKDEVYRVLDGEKAELDDE
jgi:hypothetical protein